MLLMEGNWYFGLITLLGLFDFVWMLDGGFGIGCYLSSYNLHRTSVFAGSVDHCVHECSNLYFRYAVLNGDKCSCSNTISEKELEFKDCDRPCSENSNQKCGGNNADSYYDTGIKVAGPPQNIRIINSTSSSISLEWEHPLDVLKSDYEPSRLTQYNIRTNVLRTYASNDIMLPKQWAIQRDSQPRTELTNLHSGTTYNITITSYSEKYGEGGTNSIVADTMIGQPDPEPPFAKIIKRNDQTVEIEIPQLRNDNGPINTIQVVVFFIDSELSQTFDQNLLKNFAHAQEDGTSYYIAAELSNDNRTRRFVVGDGLMYGGYLNAPLPKNRQVVVGLGIISSLGSVTKSRYAQLKQPDQNQEEVLYVMSGDTSDAGTLTTLLIIACCFFGLILVLSIFAYLYLRYRAEYQMNRLPSDHELTLQEPIEVVHF